MPFTDGTLPNNRCLFEGISIYNDIYSYYKSLSLSPLDYSTLTRLNTQVHTFMCARDTAGKARGILDWLPTERTLLLQRQAQFDGALVPVLPTHQHALGLQTVRHRRRRIRRRRFCRRDEERHRRQHNSRQADELQQ